MSPEQPNEIRAPRHIVDADTIDGRHIEGIWADHRDPQHPRCRVLVNGSEVEQTDEVDEMMDGGTVFIHTAIGTIKAHTRYEVEAELIIDLKPRSK